MDRVEMKGFQYGEPRFRTKVVNLDRQQLGMQISFARLLAV